MLEITQGSPEPVGEWWNFAITGSVRPTPPDEMTSSLGVMIRWRYPQAFSGKRGERLAFRFVQHGSLSWRAAWFFLLAVAYALRRAVYIVRRDLERYP